MLEVHRPLEAGRLGEPALLEAAALACEPDATDSLEREILAHCRSHGVDVAALWRNWRLAYDYPFDMVGKHMSHLWMRAPGSDGGAASARIVAKGALEGILEHCALEPGERERAYALNSELADQGMRVLAVAGRFAATGDPANVGARISRHARARRTRPRPLWVAGLSRSVASRSSGRGRRMPGGWGQAQAHHWRPCAHGPRRGGGRRHRP